MKTLSVRKGARYGLMVGLVVCVIAYAVSIQCLPYHLSTMAAPTYCSDSVMHAVSALTFPVTFFTNDLSAAPLYAVLPLVLYTIIGALIGLIL